jgi:small subunit ribosomal protein S9
VSEEPTPSPESVAPESAATEETPETPETPDAPDASDAPAAPVEPTPAPTPEKKADSPAQPFVWGTGRRKASVARVRIRPGEGKFLINRREVDKYFCLDKHQARVREPLVVTEAGKSFDVFVNVGGGGITGQADAISLGLARALVRADEQYSGKLRDRNLLSRDPRRVERKKYGQRGARRRFQFSKR